MEHENIVKFYGICMEQNKVCTVYSHCPKGSLQDVLQNDKLNLDVMFQQSFITDMVKVRVISDMVKVRVISDVSLCETDGEKVVRNARCISNQLFNY